MELVAITVVEMAFGVLVLISMAAVGVCCQLFKSIVNYEKLRGQQLDLNLIKVYSADAIRFYKNEVQV